MSWKTDLKLSDLEAQSQIEVTCRKCGLSHYKTPAALLAQPAMAQLYLDEAEALLRCASRVCGGPVRIALIHEDKTEGFVGGMA